MMAHSNAIFVSFLHQFYLNLVGSASPVVFFGHPTENHKQLCRSVLRWSMLAPSAAHGATGCFQFRSLIPDPVLRSCLLQCCFPSAKIFTSRSWSGPKIRRNPVTLGDGRTSKCRQLLHFYTCGYESKPWPLGTLK